MAPPALYKQVIEKMAAKGGHIDFMFLAPPTRPPDPMLSGHMGTPYELNDSQTRLKTLPSRTTMLAVIIAIFFIYLLIAWS